MGAVNIANGFAAMVPSFVFRFQMPLFLLFRITARRRSGTHAEMVKLPTR
jgi:hypothetical protein